MLHFCLEKPIYPVLCGEFISPREGWKHLTRVLYDYELMVVTEGTLYIADEKEEYEVRAGEYLIMSPNRYQHGTRECCCKFFWLHFVSDSLPASLSVAAHGAFCSANALGDLFETLFKADAAEHSGIRARYLATQILLTLGDGQYGQTQKTPQSLLCEKIKTYVWRHNFTEILVRDIARELGYHEKYLSAVFKQTEVFL